METELSKKGRRVLRRMRRPGAEMGEWAEDFNALPTDQQRLVQEALERHVTRDLERVDDAIRRTETKLSEAHRDRAVLAEQLEVLRRALGGARGGTPS